MVSWQKRPEFRWVIGIAAIFWVLCCALVLWRYYGFYPSYATFDQGIFNQVFWNSLHGRWFESSLSATESVAVMRDRAIPTVFYQRLGQHFTPALLLWLPFYALLPSVPGLSILQVTLVTAAGLVLYGLARHYHSPHLSAFIVISFYAANAVVGPTLANFHDFCQIPLFVFGLLLAMENRRWVWFGVLSGLTLLVREDAGIILFGIGAYLTLSRRDRRLGLFLCILSLGYVLVVTNWIMPRFSDDIQGRFAIEEFGQFVGNEEASSLEILWAILRNPWRLLVEIFTPLGRTIQYALAQWLPLAFVPAVSPSAWIMAGFPLLKNLLQQNPSALAIDRRFAMTVVPGLFYGAILWWSRHSARFTRQFRRWWLGCLILALCLVVTANPNRALSFVIPDSFQPWVYTPISRQWQHVQTIRSLLAQIPADASVAASSFIIPHVSGRREVLRFPDLRLQTEQQETLLMEIAVVDLWQFQQYAIAYPWEAQQLEQSQKAIARLLQRNLYGLIDFQDGVALLQRDAESNPTALDTWKTYTNSF
jgi:uncharacterized membrane protein